MWFMGHRTIKRFTLGALQGCADAPFSAIIFKLRVHKTNIIQNQFPVKRLSIIPDVKTHVRVDAAIGPRTDEGDELVASLVDDEAAYLTLVALLAEAPEKKA